MQPQDIHALLKKHVFLFDMDGTIYNDNQLFEDVPEFLSFLTSIGKKYYFLTNNSSKSALDYEQKLNRLGIKASRENIIISTHIAANYLKRKYHQDLIYVVGTKSMVKELADLGVNVTEKLQDDIKAIVVGNDNELTFSKLVDASKLLTQGVDFIATNIDRACPVSFGYVPDCGAICQMLTHATGRKPTYMGKPHAEIVNYLKAKTGVISRDVVMIGDRLYTDMMLAVKRNMTSVLVLSGEATRDTLARFPYTIDYVFDNVSMMYRTMKGAL